jgi:alkaline phosphatase D
MPHHFHSSDWKRFIQACQEGDVALVRHYLDEGIDPDFQYPEVGTVALVEAAFYGHAAIVQMLLDAGADVSIRQQLGGLNALEAAKKQGHTQVLGVLKEHGMVTSWLERMLTFVLRKDRNKMTLRVLLLLSCCTATASFAQQESKLPAKACHTVNSSITSPVISRVAFGSCAKQTKDMPALLAAKEQQPDVFVWLGDNLYGDTEDMTVLQGKYHQLSCKSEFQSLNATVPFIATWDDHDYGRDDAGKEYPFKAESKGIFLDFWQEPKSSARWQHEGIYHAFTHGTDGKRVQFILLDTRTFRDSIPPASGKGSKHDYSPHTGTETTFLGEVQWDWLRNVLSEPAELRIIATSNQFGISYNGYEAWANFPHEQQRMVQLIKDTRSNGVVFISGDVHWAEISKLEAEGCYPLYDITSSGITQSWPTLEPNTNRVGRAFKPNNFGMIEVDWDTAPAKLKFSIRNKKGRTVRHVHVALSELRF